MRRLTIGGGTGRCTPVPVTTRRPSGASVPTDAPAHLRTATDDDSKPAAARPVNPSNPSPADASPAAASQVNPSEGNFSPVNARPTPRRPAPIRQTADVLADGSGRLGLLSYSVPDELTVYPGDAVQIPFGTRTVYGMAVRAGDPAKATRAITAVFGKRSAPADLDLAQSIARFHFAPIGAVYARLAPKSGRGAQPITDTALTLADDLDPVPPARGPGADDTSRRLLIRAPLINPAMLAAVEAVRLAGADGQVLILCPTVDLVTDVTACFSAGAYRLDTKAPSGAWKGFCLGSVRVGVGTRAAALYSAPRLRGIVVVEEDNPGHVESQQPHTHARDIACARSRALRIDLTLISAAPTPQALGAGLAVLTVGARRDWPRMRLLNRADADPRTRMAPPALTRALRAAERDGTRPVVVVQRAKAVRRCGRCRAPRPCAECEESLCRHPQPDPCPQCSSTDGVRMVGWDADRVAHLLAPTGTPRILCRQDLDDVRDAGLVVVFDIDAALGAAELNPDSLATGLLVAAARSAGVGGTVVALTSDPDIPLLRDLFAAAPDQLAVARRVFTAAKKAGLPPFGRLVTVTSGQKAPPNVSSWPGSVHGPRKTAAGWELLIRLPADQLLSLEPHLSKLRQRGKVRITVT
jgi:primosomal protein N'